MSVSVSGVFTVNQPFKMIITDEKIRVTDFMMSETICFALTNSEYLSTQARPKRVGVERIL